jgi:hypothetical protein
MRWNPKAEDLLAYVAERDGAAFADEVRTVAENLVVRVYTWPVVQRYHVRMAVSTVEMRQKMRRAVATWSKKWGQTDEDGEADLLRRLEALA